MKKIILNICFAILFTGTAATAQQTMRVAYVDMDYILENVPEYQQASAQLEEKVKKWRTEIEDELRQVEAMKKELDNEKALLTDELIEEREEEIAFEEKKIFDYQQKRFGPKGDLITQKLQLIKPIQDQVFIAVQEIAKNRRYDIIFDKSADVSTLYAAEDLDVSDQVLRSITRASNREQLSGRDEKEELLREESKTVEESAAVEKRETAREQRRREREEALEERRRTRDSIRTARQLEYEERKRKVQEERQRKRDSIIKARESGNKEE